MSSAPVEPRATVEDVRQNIHIENWDDIGIPDSQIEYYLERRAAPFVDEELGDSRLAEWRLVQIEALLAGHWMAMSNVEAFRQAERTASADGSYTWFTGTLKEADGFFATTMGDSAVRLDTTGTLEAMSKDTASITVPSVK